MDFRFELSAEPGQREISYSVDEHPAVHAAGSIGKTGDEPGVKHGLAVSQHDVQSNAQVRQQARRMASAAAGAPTMRLAAVSTPARLACSTASLTASCSPKSSAVTIKNFCIGNGCRASRWFDQVASFADHSVLTAAASNRTCSSTPRYST